MRKRAAAPSLRPLTAAPCPGPHLSPGHNPQCQTVNMRFQPGSRAWLQATKESESLEREEVQVCVIDLVLILTARL